jgi:hypothetical protein
MRINKQSLALMMTVRSFWWQTWLPGYKGVRATTTGAVVLLSEKLLAHDLEHELVHVAQYQREPFVHPFLYVFASLRHGYAIISMRLRHTKRLETPISKSKRDSKARLLQYLYIVIGRLMIPKYPDVL